VVAPPASEPLATAQGGRQQIRDLRARLALSPVFGALVPNLAGFIDNRAHDWLTLAVSYVAFSAVAFIIWDANRRLYFRFPQRLEWLQRPWRRVALLFGSIMIVTIPLLTVALRAWWIVTGDPAASWTGLAMAVLLCVTCVVIVTHVYETAFVLGDWAGERTRRKRAELERLEAQVAALRYQVEPHFLFNSLNALAYLIESRNPRATEFLEALTASYRYLVATRGRALVSLGEDLAAMRQFCDVLRTRFDRALELRVHVPPGAAETWALAPVTLQELLENAVKHNVVSTEAPLVVDVRLMGETLVVANNLQPRPDPPRSTGVGLANLAGRYGLLTPRPVEWHRSSDAFWVIVPLVRAADQETPERLGGPSRAQQAAGR
jgi:hypothetical protein